MKTRDRLFTEFNTLIVGMYHGGISTVKVTSPSDTLIWLLGLHQMATGLFSPFPPMSVLSMEIATKKN